MWQGRPLDKGSVLFVPAEDHVGPKLGAEIVDGRYQIAESAAERRRGPIASKCGPTMASDRMPQPMQNGALRFTTQTWSSRPNTTAKAA